MPAVQRARGRLRPGVAAHAGRARRRRVGRQRPEGVDVERARTASGASSSPAPTPTRTKHEGITYFVRRHAHAGHRRSGRCARSTARPTSTRCSSTTCASPPTNVVGEVDERLEGRGHDAVQRAGGHRRRLGHDATPSGCGCWPRELGVGRRPAVPPALRPDATPATRSCGTSGCARRTAMSQGRAARARGVDHEAVATPRYVKEPRRPRHRACRARTGQLAAPRRAGRRRVPAEVLQRRAVVDRRRHRRDPAQHHRRAGARPARGSRGSVVDGPTRRRRSTDGARQAAARSGCIARRARARRRRAATTPCRCATWPPPPASPSARSTATSRRRTTCSPRRWSSGSRDLGRRVHAPAAAGRHHRRPGRRACCAGRRGPWRPSRSCPRRSSPRSRRPTRTRPGARREVGAAMAEIIGARLPATTSTPRFATTSPAPSATSGSRR